MNETNAENTAEKQKRVIGRPFPKGVSGNPAGKPPGTKHLSTLLWRALLEKAKKEDGTESEKTYADLVIQRLLNDNIKYGKRTELIFERIEGQAIQPVDITSNGETISTASDIDLDEMARRISKELKQKKTK